jgi:ATP-dependent helicase/nuclease subunit A
VKRISETDLIESEAKELMQDFVTREVLQDWDTEQIYDATMKERLEEQFAYSYPYADSSMVKQKLSVSELKKKIYLEEESEQAFEEEEVIPLLPKFLKEQETLTGASKGTAYHRLLELLDFTKERDEAILAKEIASYQAEGYLTEDMGACIFAKDILGFFETSIAKRARQAAEQKLLFKEQPFVLGVDAKDVYGSAGEQEIVLVQGIIDVYFEEDGELVVLDYKTDRVSRESELRERYHAQLDYYAKALEQLTGKTVKEKLIYSFALQRTIEV